MKRYFLATIKCLAIVCMMLLAAQTFGQQLSFPKGTIYKKLPNGFSYYILPQANPGKVNLMLSSNTGTLIEKPNERGVGHFLEHMVFKGSTNYPGDKTMEALESMGLRIGRDYNGSVYPTKTEYNISIPANNAAYLHQTLLLVKEWAINLEMEDAPFQIEKKVVIEEINRRGDNSSPYFNGTYLEGHSGLGTIEQVNGITHNMVKDFYKKYYTPDQLTLIVEGKVDQQALEKEINTIFGALPRSADNHDNKYLDVADQTIVSGNYQLKTSGSLPQMALAYKYHDKPVNDYVSFKRDMMITLFGSMLENRLNQQPNSSIGKAEVSVNSLLPKNSMINIRLQGAKDASYEQMLTDFAYVLEQINKYGFSQEEVTYFVGSLIDRYKRNMSDTALSVYDAERHFFTGDIPLPGKERYEITKTVGHSITPADFKNFFNEFIDFHKTILFDSTSTAYNASFSNEHILAVLRNIDTQDVTAFQYKQPQEKFAVSKSPTAPPVSIASKTPMAIKEKQVLADYVYLLTYSNGVKVLVNTAPHAVVQVKVVGKDGLNIIPDQDRWPFKLSANLFDDAFGSYKENEASRLLRQLGIVKKVDVDNYGYELSLRGDAKNVDQLIKVFHLILSENNSPAADDFNKSYSIIQKRKSTADDEDAIFNDKVNGQNISIPYNNTSTFSPADIDRLNSYNIQLKRNFSHAYVYVASTSANIDSLISTYIATVAPAPAAKELANNSKPLLPHGLTERNVEWKSSGTKIEYLFSTVKTKPVTFKDRLLADAAAEYGFKCMFTILRKKYGYIYASGTSGYSNPAKDQVAVSLRYIVEDSSKIVPSCNAMINEVIPALLKNNLPAEEITATKAMVESYYINTFYDDDRISGDYLKWGLMYGKLYSIDEYHNIIQALTAQEITKGIKELIDPQNYFRVMRRSNK